MERGRFGRFQFGYLSEDLWQSVEGNAGIQVMDVMIADICGEPSPERAGFYITRGFHRGFLVSPARIVAKTNTGKVVLGVKQISSNGAGDEVRNELRQQQR